MLQEGLNRCGVMHSTYMISDYVHTYASQIFMHASYVSHIKSNVSITSYIKSYHILDQVYIGPTYDVDVKHTFV